MLDMVANPYLRAEDVEHERKVITQESWGRYKNEKLLHHIKARNQNIYHGHKRAHLSSPLGWPETIKEISQADLRAWHDQHYVKENMYVVLAGAVTEEHLNILAKYLPSMRNGRVEAVDFGTVSSPIEARFVKNAEDIGLVQEQVSLEIQSNTPKLDWKKQLVMDEARRILSELFHERLRIDQSLCYATRLEFGETISGAFTHISVDTNVESLEKAEQTIWTVIEEVIASKHTARLAETHDLIGQQLRSAEYLSGHIADYALDEIDENKGKIVTLAETLEEQEKITAADVQDLLKILFDKKQVFTEVVLPGGKK